MTVRQHEGLPTVAELRAMPDAELVERHDALVARSRGTGAPSSDIYLGELGAKWRSSRPSGRRGSLSLR